MYEAEKQAEAARDRASNLEEASGDIVSAIDRLEHQEKRLEESLRLLTRENDQAMPSVSEVEPEAGPLVSGLRDSRGRITRVADRIAELIANLDV